MTLLELLEEAHHPRATLGRVVEPDLQLGDPPDPQPPTELTPDEGHRVLEGRDRGNALGLTADDAHPDPGMPQVGRRLDVGDRREPDPRVPHFSRQDRPDLLPQQLIDPFRPLSHLESPVWPAATSVSRM
jgi:hypothetical protein